MAVSFIDGGNWYTWRNNVVSKQEALCPNLGRADKSY
jgi:hypothetical protein